MPKCLIRRPGLLLDSQSLAFSVQVKFLQRWAILLLVTMLLLPLTLTYVNVLKLLVLDLKPI